MLHFFLRRVTVENDSIKYGPHIPYFTFRHHADSRIAVRWHVFGEYRPEPGQAAKGGDRIMRYTASPEDPRAYCRCWPDSNAQRVRQPARGKMRRRNSSSAPG